MDPNNQQEKPSIKKLNIAEEQRAIDNDVRLFQRAYDTFPDDSSKKILTEGHPDQVKKILEEKGFTSPRDIIKARNAWSQFKDVPAEKPKQTQNTTPQKPTKPSPGIGATAVGIGMIAAAPLSLLRGRQTYDNFYKNLTKSSTKIAIYWEEQNEKYLKELEKNPNAERPYGMALTREDAVEIHAKQTLDTFTRINNKKVKEWSKEHPGDNRLADSIDRIEIEKKDLKQEDFEKIRERYTKRAGRGDEESSSAEKVSEANKKLGQANNEMNDRLVQLNEKKAREWARNKNDKGLYEAIEKKRQTDIARAKKRQGRISKLLRRDPTKKFKYFGPLETPIAPKPLPMPKMHPPSVIPRSTAAITRRPLPMVAPRSSAAITHGGGRRGARAASGVGRSAAKSAGKKLGMAGAKAIFMNPYVLGTLIIAVGIIFFFLYLHHEACNLARQFPFGTTIAGAFGLDCDLNTDETNIPPPPPGFEIFKEAVGAAADGTITNDEPIEYRINVTYDPSKAIHQLSELILWDNPDFEHENPSRITNPNNSSGNSYGWYLDNFFDQSNANIQQKEFLLTIKPSVVDINIFNYAYIDVLSAGGGGDIMLGHNALPSIDDCGGDYDDIKETLIARFGEPWNYGDPMCTYTIAKVKELISTRAETNEHVNQGYPDFWVDIARCESRGNGPNAFRASGGDRMFGLFSMKQGNFPYEPWLNNPDYNRGDVTWQQQVLNAVQLNNSTGNRFTEWDSAICLCGSSKHETGEYCRYIRNNYTPAQRASRCTPTCEAIGNE